MTLALIETDRENHRERDTMEHFHRLLAFQDYRETGRARENQPQAYYDAFAEAYALGEQNAYNPPNLASKEWDGWKRSAQEDDRR